MPSSSFKPANGNNKGALAYYKNKSHYQQDTAVELTDDPGQRLCGCGVRRHRLFLHCTEGHIDGVQAPSQAPDLHRSGRVPTARLVLLANQVRHVRVLLLRRVGIQRGGRAGQRR